MLNLTVSPRSSQVRWFVRASRSVSAALALCLLLAWSPAQAQLAPGTILAVDPGLTGGNPTPGRLFAIDPNTGNRTILSDFGDPSQGPADEFLQAVAIEASGRILVTDADAGTRGPPAFRPAVFTVDPATGNRAILANFSDIADGQLPLSAEGIAVEASGRILVIDQGGGSGSAGYLLAVDPATGVSSLVSDFRNDLLGDQGPTGSQPNDVAIDASGRILVTDANGSTAAGTFSEGALFGIDPATGNRTIISNFKDPNQGLLGLDPRSVAVEASGDILVSAKLQIIEGAAVSNDPALLRVDPVSGQRTLLSDFGDLSQGPASDGDVGRIAVVPGSSDPDPDPDPEPGSCADAAPSNGCTVNGVPNQLCQTSSGINWILGTRGADVIIGGSHKDIIFAGDGDDLVCGGDGPDKIFLGAGNDTAEGGEGWDLIKGGRGDDLLIGGPDQNSSFLPFFWWRDGDLLFGGPGFDTCVGAAPGLITRILSSCEQIEEP